MSDLSAYMTTGEAAKLWRVSDRTIRRWIARGKLAAVRQNPRAHYRIPKSAVPTRLKRANAYDCPLNYAHCPGCSQQPIEPPAKPRRRQLAGGYYIG